MRVKDSFQAPDWLMLPANEKKIWLKCRDCEFSFKHTEFSERTIQQEVRTEGMVHMERERYQCKSEKQIPDKLNH